MEMKEFILALRVADEWKVKPKPVQDRHEIVECPICKGRQTLDIVTVY